MRGIDFLTKFALLFFLLFSKLINLKYNNIYKYYYRILIYLWQTGIFILTGIHSKIISSRPR